MSHPDPQFDDLDYLDYIEKIFKDDLARYDTLEDEGSLRMRENQFGCTTEEQESQMDDKVHEASKSSVLEDQHAMRWKTQEKEYRFTFKVPGENADTDDLELQVNIKASSFESAYATAYRTASRRLRGPLDLRGVYVC